ncbi:MAG TPA: isoprenylcysteine carboxylmethyltransferase family protein [Vicinamibacterales bacterium]|jgi:methyltransferase|nr:isoprenylcysteine carboxylmethyltransferase family protein [Vicinamibacterales bacterium]
MILALALVALAFVPMLAETWKSSTNERALRAAGAVEPPDDVYGLMQIAYPASFLAMMLEAWLRGRSWPVRTAAAGAAIFVAAKALKYWAIATLGPRWTFRVLVPPKSGITRGGPYRFLRHPNYVGVLGELLGYSLLAGAPVAGIAALVGFGWLLLARIRVEERALGVRRWV